MKKLFGSLATLLVVVFMISMNSCDELNEIIPVPSMKAMVDGEAWTSLARVSIFNETATPQNIVITGKPTLEETVDQAIVLTITGNDTGTYKWDILTQQFDGVVAYTLVTNAVNVVYVSTEATITVTEMDKEKNTISGTFSAKCLDPVLVKEVIITNGTFENLNYTVK